MASEEAAPTAQTPGKNAKIATPAAGSAKQRTIMSFFQKSSPGGPAPASSPLAKVSPRTQASPSSCLQETTKANALPKIRKPTKMSTPVASSDAVEPTSSQENHDAVATTSDDAPTPVPKQKTATRTSTERKTPSGGSPGRKVGPPAHGRPCFC